MTCLKALDNPVGGVTSFKEESGRSSAAIDDSVFEVVYLCFYLVVKIILLKVPRSYDVLGGASENTRRQYQVACCLFILVLLLLNVGMLHSRVVGKKRR